MKNKNKKFLKKIIVISIAIYVIYTLIAQQKTLNAYSNEKEKYQEQISKEKEDTNNLKEMEENVTSPEYIENIAREKLGMYLPNEKVFIDIGN